MHKFPFQISVYKFSLVFVEKATVVEISVELDKTFKKNLIPVLPILKDLSAGFRF